MIIINKDRFIYFVLFICFISLFLIKIPFISTFLSLVSVIIGILFYRKNIRLFLIIIIISFATIITDIFVIRNNYINDIDIFKNKNFLLGTWLYSFDNRNYVFSDNYTYTYYYNQDNKDNYCIGKYNYKHGGTTADREIIKQDSMYYYYDLTLNEEVCYNFGEKYIKNKTFNFVVGINKNNYDELIFMDVNNNNAFKISKIKK